MLNIAPMPECLLIGDDLTGTLDAAVPLAERGLVVDIRLEAETPAGAATATAAASGAPLAAAVLAVNIGSRHEPPAEAARRIAAAVATAGAPRVLYKKTDSTLRGNIGAELAALAATRPGLPIFFVPAFPAAGRTVVGEGFLQLLVEGVPVHETGFGRDPLAPVRSSRVRDCLTAGFSLPVREIGLKAVRSARWYDDGFRGLYLLAGEREEDLEAVADVLVRLALPTLLVAGPAGFSRRLPRLLGAPGDRVPRGAVEDGAVSPAQLAALAAGSTLAICGSITARSREQVRVALAVGWLGLLVPAGAGSDPGAMGRLRAEWLPAAVAAARAGRGIILHTVAAGDGTPPTAMPVTEVAALQELVVGLGAELYRAVGPTTLALFGGETTAAVLRRLGVATATAVRELMPGVNWLRFAAGGGTVNLVCKSGGFGPPDLCRLLR